MFTQRCCPTTLTQDDITSARQMNGDTSQLLPGWCAVRNSQLTSGDCREGRPPLNGQRFEKVTLKLTESMERWTKSTSCIFPFFSPKNEPVSCRLMGAGLFKAKLTEADISIDEYRAVLANQQVSISFKISCFLSHLNCSYNKCNTLTCFQSNLVFCFVFFYICQTHECKTKVNRASLCCSVGSHCTSTT